MRKVPSTQQTFFLASDDGDVDTLPSSFCSILVFFPFSPVGELSPRAAASSFVAIRSIGSN